MTSTTRSSGRDAALARALSRDTLSCISKAKVLVVGAGGIGTELLKNLVLTGFRRIEVIDLDTIEVSNLNRQFLFRRHHVSQSKAKVSREAVLQFNPNVEITAHHGNIKEDRFGSEYFSQFSLVMNALDNLEARRHVNRLCLAEDITLIESGTQGYIGQTTVIRRGLTECFECHPKPVPKTFAVCTIRSTPDKPIHCVVWAKLVFNLLFDKADDDDNILADLRAELSTHHDAKRIFDRLFRADVEKELLVEERWVARPPPTPLQLQEVLQSAPEPSDPTVLRDQRVLCIGETAHVFLKAVNAMYTERNIEANSLTFDKDDELSMTIVGTLANLRMAVYGIPPLSHFELKGIAGNIVHAIATTNAIAAGLIVLEAIKALTRQQHRHRTVWIQKEGPSLLQPQLIEPPNPSCYVCRKKKLSLHVDTTKMTLGKLYRNVLVGYLGMNQPSIDVSNRDNFIGTADEHDRGYLARPLADAGVRIDHGAMLSLDDLSQAFECDLLVSHTGDLDEEEVPEGFQVLGEVPVAQSTGADPIDDNIASEAGVTDAEDNLEPASKKQRRMLSDDTMADDCNNSDLVVIEEDSNGGVEEVAEIDFVSSVAVATAEAP